MKFKKRWLLAILISFAQLAVLLVGVIYFSNQVETEFRSFAKDQILSKNETLIVSCSKQLTGDQTAPVLNRRSQEYFKVKATRLVEQTQSSDPNAIGLIDLDSGAIVSSSGQDWLQFKDPLGQAVVQTAQGKKILGHEISSSPNGYVLSGSVSNEKRNLLVSVTRLGQSNLAMIVAQDRTPSDAAIKTMVTWLRSIGFGITLLIGLICTSLSAIVLRRYDDSLASHNNKLEQLVENRSKSLMKTKNAIIFGLAKLAESRDTDTGEHLDRIRRYVTLIANQLQGSHPEIDEKYISNIGFASSLHDIGKVGIPDGILLKPGALTSDERFIMEQHAVIGGECLEAIESKLGEDKFLEMARKIAYAHHERWDGTGYPFKLAGHDIPLEARIVSVADVYDALTTKRPYKKALSHEESKAIIVSGVGTQFDPDVVEAFLAQEESFREIAENQAGDAMPAIMAIDHSLISSPVATN